MRSFDERIAEIHRRSEKILRQRKKQRRHMLMACIPLVLCISLYAVLILPGEQAAGSMRENYSTQDGGVNTSAGGSGRESVARIEVAGLGISRVFLRQEEIASIMACIDNTAIQAPIYGNGPDGEQEMAGNSQQKPEPWHLSF